MIHDHRLGWHGKRRGRNRSWEIALALRVLSRWQRGQLGRPACLALGMNLGWRKTIHAKSTSIPSKRKLLSSCRVNLQWLVGSRRPYCSAFLRQEGAMRFARDAARSGAFAAKDVREQQVLCRRSRGSDHGLGRTQLRGNVLVWRNRVTYRTQFDWIKPLGTEFDGSDWALWRLPDRLWGWYGRNGCSGCG